MNDALERHLRVRLEDWAVPESQEGHGPPPEDPRLGPALAACLQAARDGLTLDLGRLADLQRLALPDSRFREVDAFAKGGRERYGYREDLLPLLDERLRRVHGWPPLLAALAAYLDLLFFHPFADGNARAGRLAFHFHAARGGLSFRTLGPLFTLPIPAGSERAYRTLLRIAARLAEPQGAAIASRSLRTSSISRP